MPDDIAAIVRGLTEAQRRALLAGGVQYARDTVKEAADTIAAGGC